MTCRLEYILECEEPHCDAQVRSGVSDAEARERARHCGWVVRFGAGFSRGRDLCPRHHEPLQKSLAREFRKM